MIASKPVGCINIRGVTCEETTLGSGIKGFTLRPKVNDKKNYILKGGDLLHIFLILPKPPINLLPKEYQNVNKSCKLQLLYVPIAYVKVCWLRIHAMERRSTHMFFI